MSVSKQKIKNVRNILQSPFQLKWSEKTEVEITPIQNALKELLPLAKLDKVAIDNKLEKNNRKKQLQSDTPEIQRQHNTFREFLALGFQSVIRSLENKALCCLIIAGNITPILQKVLLAYTQINNVPVTIIPDLKAITKSTLGFATMALGFKAEVSETTNKFFTIYNLVSQHQINFYMKEKTEPTQTDIIMDQTDEHAESSKPLSVTEDLYIYRNYIGERVFNPNIKTSPTNTPSCDSFIRLEKTPENFNRSTKSKHIKIKESLSSDEIDSDEDIFFVDTKQDTSLLSKECQTNKGRKNKQTKKIKFKNNTSNGISFNMSKGNLNESRLNATPSLYNKNQNESQAEVSCKKGNRQYSFNHKQDFHPLTIKTVLHDSNKKQRKKKSMFK